MTRAALAALATVALLAIAAGPDSDRSAAARAGAGPAPSGDAVARGEYVFRAAGCRACHTRDDGEPLAGGRALDTPFGRFYSPNITPDAEHGIGRWSADDLWRALCAGEGPGGVHYYPVFPYPSYARMRRADADDLHAYLMTVAPAAEPGREHEAAWFVRFRIVNLAWKWLFHDAKTFEARADRTQQWNRGAYLVRALGHCGECHTPRNVFGALRDDAHLAGNPDGPDGDPVPSIRPPKLDWSAAEIATYLKEGMTPDFDFAGGAMVEVIDEGTSHLSDADRDAIAAYLLAPE